MANYADQNFLNKIPDFSEFRGRIGVVTAKWNNNVTSLMKDGANEALIKSRIKDEYIYNLDVPGSFELIYGATRLARDNFDAVICIGVIIQGETRHFDFISQAVSNGLAKITVDFNIPIGFGVLTTDNMQQAVERAGGKHGNKGFEAAVSVLQLLDKINF
jgi:6,7-dimethyl-8-ribityllumazine synthase